MIRATRSSLKDEKYEPNYINIFIPYNLTEEWGKNTHYSLGIQVRYYFKHGVMWG